MPLLKFPLCPLAVSNLPLVGGQAVMEGVMMRRGDTYALAVRQPDGTIVVECHPWFSLTRNAFFKKPFVRGFPTLLETLVNGIKALNRSSQHCAQSEEDEIKGWQLCLTLMISLLMAVGLFVVAPHLLALVMTSMGWGGDVESISFHIWDGIFKFMIFISYIIAISFVPDIRRVFRYHGAEHKVLRAFEAGDEVSARRAKVYSRLHPRCGTTFLLFVLSIAIILHTILVPLFVQIWPAQTVWGKHISTILFKLALMIPISALAYELIHYAARLGNNLFGKILRAPGLCLQLLTTWEPAEDQLEVAVAALDGALGPDSPDRLKAPWYETPAPDNPPSDRSTVHPTAPHSEKIM